MRRMNGDVWPPFYEQPFARSGQGTAWDGLSQYDLTKFNPWYWSRLGNLPIFATTRGLVLFNENYFQHNILEDGAHWVDCPWRSATTSTTPAFTSRRSQVTKRIFMAEQFYDVSNPVRRKLHADFIRQNLNNFTNEANVIQFTSAEFTGPLAFVQFWLDTIGDWEQRDQSPCARGAATPEGRAGRDPRRSQRARRGGRDRFRYWWRTDKGCSRRRAGKTYRRASSSGNGRAASRRRESRGDGGGIPPEIPAKAVIAAGDRM